MARPPPPQLQHRGRDKVEFFFRCSLMRWTNLFVVARICRIVATSPQAKQSNDGNELSAMVGWHTRNVSFCAAITYVTSIIGRRTRESTANVQRARAEDGELRCRVQSTYNQ